MQTYWIIYEFVVKYAAYVLSFFAISEVFMKMKQVIKSAMKHKGVVKKAVKAVKKYVSVRKASKAVKAVKAIKRSYK